MTQERMGRKPKNIEQETKSVSVMLDMPTYRTLNLLAFLRECTVASLIADLIASKSSAIRKETDERLAVLRRPVHCEGEAGDEARRD